MTRRQRHAVRHCPVCGIAMQASSPQEGERRFECLTCHTTIVERPASRDIDESPLNED